MAIIADTQELRALYAEPKERAVKKQLPQLDRHCINFLALARFVVLSTCESRATWTHRRVAANLGSSRSLMGTRW